MADVDTAAIRARLQAAAENPWRAVDLRAHAPADIAALLAENERLRDLVAEFRSREESQDRIRGQLARKHLDASAKLDAVRELHVESPDGDCKHCCFTWPCATVRALDGEAGTDA
ncbi:MAG: hypothetical protein GEU78_09575 [Actinobacteria bacterium]|nr:hypothetical protein [Actinomycetota bacterium]